MRPGGDVERLVAARERSRNPDNVRIRAAWLEISRWSPGKFRSDAGKFPAVVLVGEALLGGRAFDEAEPLTIAPAPACRSAFHRGI
jgi:hypothetical protein